jgi:hypothetical protein
LISGLSVKTRTKASSPARSFQPSAPPAPRL